MMNQLTTPTLRSSFFTQAHYDVSNLNGLLRAVGSGLRVELQNFGAFALILGPQELHIANNLTDLRQWIDDNLLLHDVPQNRSWSLHRFRTVLSQTELHRMSVKNFAMVGAQLIIETPSGSYITADGYDEEGTVSLLIRFQNA